jgi:hypothetical protein
MSKKQPCICDYAKTKNSSWTCPVHGEMEANSPVTLHSKEDVSKKCEHPHGKIKNHVCTGCGLKINPPKVTFTKNPDPEEWKTELREFVDKVFKPKGKTMINLDRELLVNFVSQEKEKSYQDGLHQGYEEEAHKHCEQSRRSVQVI